MIWRRKERDQGLLMRGSGRVGGDDGAVGNLLSQQLVLSKLYLQRLFYVLLPFSFLGSFLLLLIHSPSSSCPAHSVLLDWD